MPKNGPIIIIEDDMDDRFILEEALREAGVNNELIFFDNGQNLLSIFYLPLSNRS